MQQQPWIGRPLTDIVFILMPPFVSLLFIFSFPSLFQNNSGLTNAGWVILILLIDVAHVYSTLYRTYFDPGSFQKQRPLLLGIPFVGWVAGVLAYSISAGLFWRLLAYTAVFHFVRQQYGFMRVYSRKEEQSKWEKRIDIFTIYYATLYPLLYWHLNGPRNFNWFTDHDFLYFDLPFLSDVLTGLYFITLGLYVAKETIQCIKRRSINIPKVAVITGTLLSWYFGIVYFNGDLAFTLLNVVSHGIPYMALVWIYGRKTYTKKGRGNKFLSLVFSRYGLFIFLGIIFALAFIEEGIWDIAVWKEHARVFGTGRISLPPVSDTMLSFLVPLLALPQITHYILDGFIWRIRHDEFKWNNEVRPV